MKLKRLFFGITCFVFLSSYEHLPACSHEDENEACIENSTNIIIINENDDDCFILKVAIVCGIVAFVGYLISRYLTPSQHNSLPKPENNAVPINHQVPEIAEQPAMPSSQDSFNNPQQPDELFAPAHAIPTAKSPDIVITPEPQQESIPIRTSKDPQQEDRWVVVSQVRLNRGSTGAVRQQLGYARTIGFNPMPIQGT